MAGLFDDIGEFFTGDRARSAQNQANQLAEQTANVQKQQAAEQAALQKSAQEATGRYDTGTAESMGTNAADMMARANAASLPQAAQQANAASIGAARNALMAARTAGLNRGAAAVQAGQQSTQDYNQNLQSGLQQGRQQYGQNTQQFANRADTLANRGMQYQQQAQQARGIGAGAQTANNAQNLALANQSAQAGGGLLSGALSAIPGFADGTECAPGGAAVVGERGPEVVELPAGSKVIPHEVLMAKAMGKPIPLDYLMNKIKGGQ